MFCFARGLLSFACFPRRRRLSLATAFNASNALELALTSRVGFFLWILLVSDTLDTEPEAIKESILPLCFFFFFFRRRMALRNCRRKTIHKNNYVKRHHCMPMSVQRKKQNKCFQQLSHIRDSRRCDMKKKKSEMTWKEWQLRRVIFSKFMSDRRAKKGGERTRRRITVMSRRRSPLTESKKAIIEPYVSAPSGWDVSLLSHLLLFGFENCFGARFANGLEGNTVDGCSRWDHITF